MALYTVQTPVPAGITPTAITPSASDTISGNDIAPGGGVLLRVITTGTATNVSILDPNLTALGNTVATPPVVACPATGVRLIFVPPAAVNNAASPPVATVTYSSIVGVTVEAYRS